MDGEERNRSEAICRSRTMAEGQVDPDGDDGNDDGHQRSCGSGLAESLRQKAFGIIGSHEPGSRQGHEARQQGQ